MSVYCLNCKYYVYDFGHEHCKHSSNVSIERNAVEERKIYKRCDDANKNNDCKYYSKSWWSGVVDVLNLRRRNR